MFSKFRRRDAVHAGHVYLAFAAGFCETGHLAHVVEPHIAGIVLLSLLHVDGLRRAILRALAAACAVVIEAAVGAFVRFEVQVRNDAGKPPCDASLRNDAPGPAETALTAYKGRVPLRPVGLIGKVGC